MYEKAIALDPQYAQAYSGLGLTYYMEWNWRWSQDPQTLEQALAMTQRAIALDSSLPVAHGFLGWVYAQKQQYDQAIAEGERAIALDPNDADSYARQAEVLSFAGRPEAAIPGQLAGETLSGPLGSSKASESVELCGVNPTAPRA
jgi:tetratricopeptide (TPR) repeat protein